MLTLEQFQDWHGRRVALKNLPRRLLALLAATWAYRVLPIFERQYPGYNQPRLAIEATVQWVIEPTPNNRTKVKDAAAATYAAAAVAYAAAAVAYAAGNAVDVAAYVAGNAAAYVAGNAATTANENLWPWLYETYQRCLGEGREWSPEWTTPETVAIARKCVLELNKGDLPYLADALEDAGYRYEADLERLRSGQGEWSDWPVWNLIANTTPAGSCT